MIIDIVKLLCLYKYIMQQTHEHLTTNSIETVRQPSLLRRIGGRLLKSIIGERPAPQQNLPSEQQIQQEVHTGLGQLEEFLQESVVAPGRHSAEALGSRARPAIDIVKREEIRELTHKYSLADIEHQQVTGRPMLFTHSYPQQGNPYVAHVTPDVELLKQYPLPESYGKPPTQPQHK